LSNLYTLTLSKPSSVEREADVEQTRDEIEKEIVETMTTETSPYDSHPSPQQRIAWVSRLAPSVTVAPRRLWTKLTFGVSSQIKRHFRSA